MLSNSIFNFTLTLISDNQFINIPSIAKNRNRGITVTKDRITKLKNNGIIIRIGADKGGYWKIIK
jgi:hypothetical protein